ncbi:hypothetical protein BSY18_1827 [Blastomonas sp. RAC04]|uniref:hypothetical protein n=1 Tax=Blastomonas sp. RAC04 TaxID=1842535 RepID=UPI000856176A|nr:hypothetical protein [Blastomonas sp. RAC04]AOG01308.1 hypothetical protein BSY18_1827 [Blastomonas sp. RAC04]
MRQPDRHFPFAHAVKRLESRQIVSGIILVVRRELHRYPAPAGYGSVKIFNNELFRRNRLSVLNEIFVVLAACNGKGRPPVCCSARANQVSAQEHVDVRHTAPNVALHPLPISP